MELALSALFIALPAAIWRIRVIGLAEIELRIAHWLLLDSRARRAAAETKVRERAEVEGIR